MSGSVRTVCGDVDPGSLGITYSHEHLLNDPGEHFTGGDTDLVLNDEDRALEELERFRDAGGGALVECTTEELGRHPEGLRRLSQRSGIAIVAVTGHITPQHWTGVVPVEERGEEELVERFVSDLTHGMDGTGIQAGAIKVGSSEGEITPAEHRVIRAAAAAQRETGAPITTHTTAGTVPVEQSRSLAEAGADLEHVCVGHLDRRLDADAHEQLARMGAYLGYDCIGKEKYQPDEARAQLIGRLVARGLADRICLGGDMARRSYLESWGGDRGYRFIIEEFVPRLRATGLDEGTIRGLLVDNPARHLTWT